MKVKKWRYPKAVELVYQIYLRNYVRNQFKEIKKLVLQKLPHLISDVKTELQHDGWSDEVGQLIKGVEISFDVTNPKGELQGFLKRIGNRTIEWNDREWRGVLRQTMGVENVFKGKRFEKGYLESFINENVGLISKLDEEALQNTRQILESGLRSSDRYETIAEEIETRLGEKLESRAEFIARDQVAKFNGDLTKARQTNLGIETYYWRTVEDERVRDEHASLDGKLCRWDDEEVYSDDNGKTWKKRTSEMFIGHPGEDFQCRCSAEPNIEELQDIEEEANVDQ